MLLLGFAQFWEARNFKWYWDDHDHLDHVEQILRSPSVLLSNDHPASARTLTSLYFLLLSPFDVVVQHTAHVAVYILTACFLAFSLSRLGYNRPLAMLAGLLFLFNVSHWAVAYWPSCFAYTACLATGVWGVVAYRQWSLQRARSQHLTACILIAISTLFHPGGIAFSLLGPYCGYRARGLMPSPRSALILPAVTIAVAALLRLVYPTHNQNQNLVQFDGIPATVQLALSYLGRTFLSPHWLTDAFLVGPTHQDWLVGLLILGVGGVLLYLKKWTLLDGIVWSTLTVSIYGVTSSEEFTWRYFYLANVGPSLVLAYGLISLGAWASRLRCSGWQWAIPALGCAAIVGFSHGELKITERIFQTRIGRSYLVRGDRVLGVEQMGQGILGSPAYTKAADYTRYGTVALYAGTDPEPVLALGEETYPDDSEIRLVREAAGYAGLGISVESDFIRRVENEGEKAQNAVSGTFSNAASYHYNEGNNGQAERLYASALQVQPGNIPSIIHRANTLLRLNRSGDALAAYGDVYSRQAAGYYAASVPGLRAIHDAYPANTTVRGYLILAYVASEDLTAADGLLASIPRGFRQTPALVRAVAELAEAHRQSGNEIKAKALQSYLTDAKTAN